MKSLKPSCTTQISFWIHALVLGVVAIWVNRFPHPLSQSSSIEIDLVAKKDSVQFVSPQNKMTSVNKTAPLARPAKHFDLRPSYLKGNSLSHMPISRDPKLGIANLEDQANSQANSTNELLNTPLHVTTAFDHLAAQIDRNLDYPNLLVEHNVQGYAVLDLRFDNDGKVNESESSFSGNHRAVRGLLVKAARLALQEWYKSDAYRLARDEYRGQHFRAELEISYTERDESSLEKNNPNDYQMIRRRFKNECANPLGVDLLCVALKTEGAVEDAITDASRIKFELLKDKLSYDDDLGLKGINDWVAGS
jgi:hypothetical protein